MKNGRLLIAFFFTIICSNLFSQVIIVQDKEGHPIPYAHVSPKGSTSFIYITNQDGVVTINQPNSIKELIISHVSFKEHTVNLNGNDTLRVIMDFFYQNLGEVEVNVRDDKDIFESAIESFEESVLNKPFISKTEFVQLAYTENGSDPVYYRHSFGLYIFQEAIDRTKKKNNWLETGYGAFLGQQTRFWRDKSLGESVTHGGKLSVADGIYRVFKTENLGYLNDLYREITQTKFVESDSSYIKDQSVFYVFNIIRDQTDIALHIHADKKALSKIIATRLPLPEQPSLRFGQLKKIEVEVGARGSVNYIAKIKFESYSPNTNLSLVSEMIMHEKSMEWKTPFNGAKLDAFFPSLGDYPNVKNNEWKQSPFMALVSSRFQNKMEGLNYSAHVYGSSTLKSIEDNSGVENQEVQIAIEAGNAYYEYWIKLNEYFESVGAYWTTNGQF
jgi:hypothetical protein